MSRARYDAVVVGAGPNGLAAAIVLAQAGRSVLVREANATIGGGARSAELTLPGFVHDLGSAIHPLAAGSPFFRTLPLERYGLEWIYPPAQLAHPLDDGTAVVLERGIGATAAGLGPDGAVYRRLMEPLVAGWNDVVDAFLGPLRPVPLARHPFLLARFGLRALWPARRFAELLFEGERARALFAGLAAHSFLPLEQPPSAGVGLMLAMAGHAVGWPLPRGGAGAIAAALAAYLRALGGEIVPGAPVESLADLPRARAVLFDLTPRQILRITGHRLPPGYRRRLERYRYGPAAFKIDWALDGPIPWTARECMGAGTVHLGGTLSEISVSERAVGRGLPPEQPFVLLAQQTLFDPTRAPVGRHTAWAYCHVPNGSTFDMIGRLEAQIERFAPGFAARVLARHVTPPRALELQDANLIGGDINGGVQDLRQFFTRPLARLNPYVLPARGLYICSSSSPPGGGVHGMSGYFAARTALKNMSYRQRTP